MSLKNIVNVCKIVIVIAAAIVLVAGIVFWGPVLVRHESVQKVDSSTFQAVLLTNDQIYFGHLKDIYSPYPVLIDVSYIKLTGDNQGNNVSQFVKLGQTEFYGPQGMMVLNPKTILFWENIRSDSPFIKKIESTLNNK